MWNWLNCYFSGRHDFGISCEPGAIFLRCIHCGKRSNGWALKEQQAASAVQPLAERPQVVRTAGPLPFTPRGIGRLHHSA